MLATISICRFGLCLYDNGVADWVYQQFRRLLSGTINVFGYAFNSMNVNKFSRILWILALLNASLIVYFIYVNVDILQIFRTLAGLAVDFIRYITDPVAILKSFDILLKKLYGYKLMIALRDRYFTPAIEQIQNGEVIILFQVSFITLCLIFIGSIPRIFSFESFFNHFCAMIVIIIALIIGIIALFVFVELKSV